ncbi:MAG TPA: sulfatase-like hydrolase/transferase [Thermoanaerobaculia bacterium]|nr:sulfatase-like hydrolase/transferase [Thermoanaerobaculia bacterium]
MLRTKSKLRRARSLALVLLLTLPLGWGCSHVPSNASRNPNLLLVTVDTVRADHLGCYGYRAAVTPWLDRLATEGIRFEAASSSVPLTLPSHATVLSGLLPLHHGLRNNGAGALPAGTATLATLLAGSGYRTGAFVGAFVLDRRFGLGQGFEVYDDEIPRDPRAGVSLESERPGREVVDRALAWLKNGDDRRDRRDRRDDRPFFLWVHLYDAHAPYTPPPAWSLRHPGRPYDGEISEVDEQVGRLLAELDHRGIAGRTVVAVAADHGESLGEHGELTHGLLLYEPTLHVPLLLRAPGRLTSRVVRTPVSLVDLAPTLAGLLGRAFAGPGVRPRDGRDLAPDLLAGREPAAGEVYAESQYPAIFGWSPLAALRRRDLKYIAAPKPELYDLGKDPKETANLLDREPAAKGFAARLAEIEAGAVAAPRPAAADAETRARLASLGYVAGAAPRPAPAKPGAPAGIDPKTMVDLFQRFERANTHLQDGDVKAALGDLEALVAADPGNPVFRGKLAEAWRSQGDFARAVPLYRQAAAAAPADPEAWYNLAAALQEAGRLPEARGAIERALKLDASRPEAHNTLGIVEMGEGKLEPARQEFETAARLDPRNAHALNNLGNVLKAMGRLDDAEHAYQRSAALAPRYAEPLNGLGTLEVERDQPRAALPYFERALALAPGYHEVRLNRAIALDLAGDPAAGASAYRDFLAATAGDPRFAEQRRAAQQLLARLTSRVAGGAPAGRR